MKQCSRVCRLVAVVALGIGLSLAAPSLSFASPKNDVLDAVNARFAAMVELDNSGMMDSFADEVVIYDPMGRTLGKIAYIKKMGKGGTDHFLSVNLINPRVNVYENVATFDGVVNARVEVGGKVINTYGRHLDVLVFREGRWQVIASQGAIAK